MNCILVRLGVSGVGGVIPARAAIESSTALHLPLPSPKKKKQAVHSTNGIVLMTTH